MSIAKQMNAAVKAIAAVQKGKINLDAPAIRTALKSIAVVIANQVEELRKNGDMKSVSKLAKTISTMAMAEHRTIKAKKRAKAKRGKK